MNIGSIYLTKNGDLLRYVGPSRLRGWGLFSSPSRSMAHPGNQRLRDHEVLRQVTREDVSWLTERLRMHQIAGEMDAAAEVWEVLEHFIDRE